MAERILGPQGSKRRTRFLWVPMLAIAALALLFAVGAQAVHDTGAFELDGNATNGAALGDDWDNVCHQATGTGCSTTSNTNGATAVSWVAELNTNATIFTGGGSKDPQDINNWAWKDGAGGLPDKDNLLHSFAARYNTTEGDVLFFGSDRLDNSGDAQQGFWFFQNPVGLGNNSVGGGSGFTGVHQTGDVLVISDFSNGGTTSTITVYKWDTSCKKTGGTCGDANLRTLGTSTNAKCSTAAANDAFCGIVNPGTITMPWSFTDKSGTANNGALNGEFYEGGINLTNLGLAGECFSSVASETRSSTSTTATLKDFVLGNFGHCGSTTVTQQSVSGTVGTSGYPSTSIGTGSVTVSDQATVSVTNATTWAGNVQFHLRGPIGAANETSVDIGAAQPVSNSSPTANSPGTNTVTSAGDYCWSATFAPTTDHITGSSDDGTNECFTVNPVTPSLPTTAGDDVSLGSAVTDTAALSGTSNQPGSPVINPTTAGAAAGGTITFALYKADCTTPATGTAGTLSFTVSGDNTYGPASFTPDAAGTYHWKATYAPATGDPNNVGSTYNSNCTDANEDVVVSTVASSMSSAQSFIPNDSATITAPSGGNLAGSVKFEVFANATCTGASIYDQTVTVSGASPQTVHTTNTTVSTTAANVSWRLTYTSTNSAQRSISANCFEKTGLTIDNGGTISSGP